MTGEPTIIPGWYPVDTDEAIGDLVPITATDAYPPYFPGYVGVEGESNPAVDSFAPSGFDRATDTRIDYDSDHDIGLVNVNPYAVYGPVEPTSVEAMGVAASVGMVLNNPRQAEYGSGPVSHLDYMEYNAQQLAAEMSPEISAEQSLAMLLLGGY